jgi:integration host factor subunit alpha
MQIGFSKKISASLLDDFFITLVDNLKFDQKLKILKFGTFSIRHKKSRIGRNPRTKEKKNISDRNVVLFKASKEFKDLVNSKNDS